MNDNNNDDQWRHLQESLNIDMNDDEVAEISGALHLPSLRSNKAESAPKRSKKPKNKVSGPMVRSRQATLTQPSFSEVEMEKQLAKYRQRTAEEEVDYRKYLEDDSESDSCEREGDEEDDVDITRLTSALLGEATTSKQDDNNATPMNKDLSNDGHTPEIVGLSDEVYPIEGVKTTRRFTQRGSGGGYKVEEQRQEEICVTKLLEDPARGARGIPSPEMDGQDQDRLFYWFDAKEQSYQLSVDPGAIFLFGKIYSKEKKAFLSCCLRVRNAERVVFALPKPGSTDTEVVQEVNELCRAQGILKRRMKFVDRFYGFEEECIPHEKARWLKVRYPGSLAPFSSKGPWKHINAVLGSSASLLELFLLKRKMKGPGFLQVKEKTAVEPGRNVSHCDYEYYVDSPKLIQVDSSQVSSPPFTIASIQLHAQLDSHGGDNEILLASLAVYKDVAIDHPLPQAPTELLTGIRPDSSRGLLPVDLEIYCEKKVRGLRVKKFKSEYELLMWLGHVLRDVDPDMLVGHNFVGYTLNTLLRRVQELNVSDWSTLGRLDLKRLPRLQSSSAGTYLEREVCCGRLLVDTYSLARDYFKSTNYKLLALSDEMKLQGLTTGRTFEPGSSRLIVTSSTTSAQLCDVVLQVCNSAVLAMAVASHLDVIRLTKRLSFIAGNLWSRTLYGARSERIEYLLLHAFHALKFIVPDRRGFEASKRRRDDDEEVDDTKRKAKYQGGMVLEPKCGLYSDYILLLDFNSLYPSLIQEFNICFTTVNRWGDAEVDVPPPENLICSCCAAAGLPSPCVHKCVLPRVIKSLVDQRREVKRLMKGEKDPNQLSLLEIRQKALKLTANSMYGCLGFEFSRFYAQPLAELVTRQGRLALQNAVELVPQFRPSVRVIYGDTDSVMIQTGIKNDIQSVRRLGLELKAEINKRYQSLEIDIDGVFRSILLLKKKKYAALSIVDWQEAGKVYKTEVKGLDMVRRDWCPLSKRVCDTVLSRVLYAEGGEDVLDYIMRLAKDVAAKVRQGEYALDDFVISKSLTKEPELYRGNSFPHALVALRMRQRKELVRVGDLIPYVICSPRDGDEKLVGERAYHVEEVRQQKETLSLDSEWYLASQIYPPLMRLCEHIQGFTTLQLSEVMGLQIRQCVSRHGEEGNDIGMDFSHCSLFTLKPLKECFPTALPFQIACPHCHSKTPIDPHQRVQDVLKRTPAETVCQPNFRFHLYVCTVCLKAIDVHYVANSLSQLCHLIVKEFYLSGGSVPAVRALRTQFTYFRALFDVPCIPGCPLPIQIAHRQQALLCVAPGKRALFTMEEAKTDERRSDDDEEKKYIVDPVFLAVESYYNRVQHLFISLENFFLPSFATSS